MQKWNFRVLIFLLCASFIGEGCAYRFGAAERQIPGGYLQVAVPVFINRTFETGIEVYFTNALIRQIERSKIAHVTQKSDAEVIIQGEISTLQYTPTLPAQISGPGAPEKIFLAPEYTITMTANVTVKRKSDMKVLWQGSVSGESIYTAPQIYSYGFSSANPLYNLSARRQNISSMADEMMAEANDRMTENF